MGSDFANQVSVDEAAKILHRSRRQVGTYMKNGLLRPQKDGNRTFLLRSDVEELAVELGAGFPPMNRKTFYRLCAHVQKLETDLAVLKRMNGFYDSPLRPNQEDAAVLYKHAERALNDGIWQVEEIERWASLFEKTDDVFFDILADQLEKMDAWRPFYELCLRQDKQITVHPDFPGSMRLHALHSQLQGALIQMRKVILAWVEAGHSAAAHNAAAIMDGEAEAVLRRLSAKA